MTAGNHEQNSDENSWKLLQKVADGDDLAMRMLINEHKQKVFGTAYNMLGDYDIARDLAQEVFIAVWKNAKKFRGDASFNTWLHKIVRNKIYSHLRKKKVRSFLKFTDDKNPEITNAPDSNKTRPDKITQSRELQKQIYTAINQLPRQQRLALTLHRLDGHSHQQVAEIMKTTIPSVKSHIHRAKENLKTVLAKLLNES